MKITKRYDNRQEYEEALKSAVTQGGEIQMNVYEVTMDLTEPHNTCPRQVCESGATVKFPILKKGKKPHVHYSALGKAIGQELRNKHKSNEKHLQRPSEAERINEKPPEWFTSYMENFKKEVVKETTEKLSEKLIIQSPHWNSSNSSMAVSIQVPENQTTQSGAHEWMLPCSNCRTKITGVRYQCSVCPAYSLCELCEGGGFSHDSSHVFLKLRKPVLTMSESNSLSQIPFPRISASVEQVSIPMQPCTPVVPTLSAVFVDENLPDGTHLQPGTKFIKHWRMKNTGNVKWSSDTKLTFMWGNLTLLSSANKDVSVPSLHPGEIGILSVEFIAPTLEGTYTSHWRLAHKGEQFGPRVWCSIIVDPFPCTDGLETSDKTLFSSSKMSLPSCKTEQVANNNMEVPLGSRTEAQDGEVYEQMELPAIPFKIRNVHRDSAMYLPSVDLLTAQDLLSFELLDINIVQEMERVPHNTPVDMTPCMSPLPHDNALIEKPGLGQIEEENEGVGFKALSDPSMVKVKVENAQEECEEDISSTQFVCETVMRSLTLDAAPDHIPPQRKKDSHCSLQTLSDSFSYSVKSEEGLQTKPINILKTSEPQEEPSTHSTEENELVVSEKIEMPSEWNGSDEHSNSHPEDIDDGDDNSKDEVQSQGSSASSEDYFIILPECFDTSRPLAESMYSSAMSQSEIEKGETGKDLTDDDKSETRLQVHNINDILTTSQTLDAVPLMPQVVSLPPQLQSSHTELQNSKQPTHDLEAAEGSDSTANQIKEEPSDDYFNEPTGPVKPKIYEHSRPNGSSIAGGLVKGALSVAASAYKALFAGQPVPTQPPGSEDQTATMIAILFEMGFCDRQLNQRLLKKHNYNLMEVVTELIQINDNDWYASRY
ncbi:next to BRCA1 gene 1 protein isoform X9 [Lissotriton helveticus]